MKASLVSVAAVLACTATAAPINEQKDQSASQNDGVGGGVDGLTSILSGLTGATGGVTNTLGGLTGAPGQGDPIVSAAGGLGNLVGTARSLTKPFSGVTDSLGSATGLIPAILNLLGLGLNGPVESLLRGGAAVGQVANNVGSNIQSGVPNPGGIIPPIGDSRDGVLGYPPPSGRYLPGLTFPWFNDFPDLVLMKGQGYDKIDFQGLLENLADVLKKVQTNDAIISKLFTQNAHKIKIANIYTNSTLTQMINGKLNEDAGMSQLTGPYQDTIVMLTELGKKIFAASGVDVDPVDVDKFRSIMSILVGEIMFTVKLTSTTLGVRPELKQILHSVVAFLNNNLIGLVALNGALGPPIYGAISPILMNLGQSIGKPLLGALADALKGLPH
ncbi:hypothetical protein VHEMI00559 [[Torrubiella] hemipterigena]|uniref:Uncharacterized protein n=1 Tax=[Torrubiella] hemipterigena TaxID=1531966 RepID=A0A0A1T4V1_9HYPO|nr:hypothetical protein VHEMI00559 [[Torrubiella] hemipterigena]